MQIDTLKLVYFSPTGTTRTILKAVAEGLQAAHSETIDLTPPDARNRQSAQMDHQLALIGMPVYAGRIPAEAAQRLQRVKGNCTPAVLVVVYGNRAFEDALLELSDLANTAGFIPVAGAAFIGEHSYTTTEKPLATGRPDAQDLTQAVQFGRQVRKKLAVLSALEQLPALAVPGNHPYRNPMLPSDIAPVTEEALCTLCGVCAEVCPTGAVTVNGSVQTTGQDCIVCCVCIKSCPTGARVMRDERIISLAERLFRTCTERKQPEIFL